LCAWDPLSGKHKKILISHMVQLHHEDSRYEQNCGEEWAATVDK
jgi:hypothetical protein